MHCASRVNENSESASLSRARHVWFTTRNRPDFRHTADDEEFVPEPVLERTEHFLLRDANFPRFRVDHVVHRIGRFIAQQGEQEQSMAEIAPISVLVHVRAARTREAVENAPNSGGHRHQVRDGFRRAAPVQRATRESPRERTLHEQQQNAKHIGSYATAVTQNVVAVGENGVAVTAAT